MCSLSLYAVPCTNSDKRKKLVLTGVAELVHFRSDRIRILQIRTVNLSKGTYRLFKKCLTNRYNFVHFLNVEDIGTYVLYYRRREGTGTVSLGSLIRPS